VTDITPHWLKEGQNQKCIASPPSRHHHDSGKVHTLTPVAANRASKSAMPGTVALCIGQVSIREKTGMMASEVEADLHS